MECTVIESLGGNPKKASLYETSTILPDNAGVMQSNPKTAELYGSKKFKNYSDVENFFVISSFLQSKPEIGS
jgi:hypothetical protein